MADGIELAKAYVQIIPSTKGIKGSLTEAMSGEAGEAGHEAGRSIASAIRNVLVTAGIGTVIKDSIMEGTNLQQSLGGIETLFRDSSDKVIASAKNAYKTAGMSANEYMETVTSFSASLLQGLAGDTNKAADVADMALTDMSDNANKMGTSMELIQNAYNGFAKQNYTMLDNLKLGYGGTKTEMQRLLADAQKLTGVKYDMDNLADVYEAIHVIQEEMGITGTTAKEAASTFSGSLASMKGAWSNLLGAIALGENVREEITALGETVFTFVRHNMIPMVGNVLQGVGDIVAILAEKIVNTDWMAVATKVVTKLGNGISRVAGEILGVDTSIIDSIAKSVVDKLPSVFEKISTTFKILWETLQTVWTEIGLPVFEKASVAVEWVSGKFTEYIKSGELVRDITTKVSGALNFFKGAIEPIREKLQPFIDGLIEYATSGELAKDATSVLSDVIGILREAFGEVKEALQPLIDKIVEYVGSGQLAEDAMNTLKAAIEATKEAFDTITAWINENRPLMEVIATVIGSVAAAYGIVTTAVTVWNTIAGIATTVTAGLSAAAGVLSGALAFITSPIGIAVGAIAGLIAIGVTLYRNWDTIKEKCTEFAERVKEIFGEIKESVQLKIDELKSAITTKVTQVETSVKNTFERIKNSIGDKLNSAKDTVKNALEKIKGFFNFSWSLPKLKMPHFSIKGSFSLDPPSVPTIGIDWYAKAMKEPVIMNSPTAFGINSLGQIMAGGEAGSEVVSGTDTLMNMIAAAVASKNERMENVLLNILAYLMEIMPQLANMQVVADTGMLIGAIAPGMDEEMGLRREHKERGN